MTKLALNSGEIISTSRYQLILFSLFLSVLYEFHIVFLNESIFSRNFSNQFVSVRAFCEFSKSMDFFTFFFLFFIIPFGLVYLSLKAVERNRIRSIGTHTGLLIQNNNIRYRVTFNDYLFLSKGRQ